MLHETRVLEAPDLCHLARRWRLEKRLVNPIARGLALGNATRQIHHEALAVFLDADIVGEAVARWAERTAARAQSHERQRRAAHERTSLPPTPMEFVRVEARRVTTRNIPVSAFLVHTRLVTQAQWVSAMRSMPHAFVPVKGRWPWRTGGRTVWVDPDAPVYVSPAEVGSFLERMNGHARTDRRRFDLPTYLEQVALIRAFDDGLRIFHPGPRQFASWDASFAVEGGLAPMVLVNDEPAPHQGDGAAIRLVLRD
jgi:hypothetical protein